MRSTEEQMANIEISDVSATTAALPRFMIPAN